MIAVSRESLVTVNGILRRWERECYKAGDSKLPWKLINAVILGCVAV